MSVTEGGQEVVLSRLLRVCTQARLLVKAGWIYAAITAGGGTVAFLKHNPTFGGDQTPRKKHCSSNSGSKGPVKRKNS